MEKTFQPFEPIDTTTNSTVASVSISDSETGETKKTTSYTYPVVQPEEYKNEFMISLRASDIRKVKKICSKAQKSQFPFHELLLGLSTTLIGCTLGALGSGIHLSSFAGVIFYILCPIIATGTFVSYIFIRKSSIKDINELVENVEEYIPNPDRL